MIGIAPMRCQVVISTGLAYHVLLISKKCPYFEVQYYVLENIIILISTKCP